MAKQGGDLCTHVIYSILLLFSAIAATLAAASPFWIKSAEPFDGNITSGGNDTFACGVLSDCSDASNPSCDIEPYGDQLDSIPVSDWRISAVMLGIACAVLWASFIVSFITCCFCYSCTKIQAPLIALATIMLFGSMIAFGHGLGDTQSAAVGVRTNPDVKCICGLGADSFDNADCELGIGASLAIAATVVTLFTACIAYKVKHQDIDAGRYE
eukprot:m.74457 g.74457  ORF g.74457 m.74457 type:complete len:213 (+) comp14361_c0_seq1:164-802(+)